MFCGSHPVFLGQSNSCNLYFKTKEQNPFLNCSASNFSQYSVNQIGVLDANSGGSLQSEVVEDRLYGTPLRQHQCGWYPFSHQTQPEE